MMAANTTISPPAPPMRYKPNIKISESHSWSTQGWPERVNEYGSA